MANLAFLEIGITKYNEQNALVLRDTLVVEEPLELRLQWHAAGKIEIRNISVTMRTPGNDKELSLGFLFTEKIINRIGQVQQVLVDPTSSNSVTVQLVSGIVPELKKMERNFYTSSSCGVCGKASIEALDIASGKKIVNANKIAADVLYSLGGKLREKQKVFEFTGGLHAAALFDVQGNLLVLREDVGRHNALDKLIGYFVLKDAVPVENAILLLSGRASFELIQKAGTAGIKWVAAIGAPSSLAVETAEQFGITLIGFLRSSGFNIYSHPESIANVV
jgi:FdhD protein